MQLDVTFKHATGLKHEGKHCVEVLLDGHSPQRTDWVSDLYDSEGSLIKPKNFKGVRRTVKLKGSKEVYHDAWLHITLIHQRTFREDKRAAEAHVPFSKVVDGFTGWVALEHKEKYGGRIFIVAKLTEVPQAAAKNVPAPLVPAEEMEEQLAILASIQQEHRQQLASSQSSRASVDSPKKDSTATTPLQESWPGQPVRLWRGLVLDADAAGGSTTATSWPAWPEPAGTSAPASSPPAWPDWPAPPAQQALQSAPPASPSPATKQSNAPLQLPFQSRQLPSSQQSIQNKQPQTHQQPQQPQPQDQQLATQDEEQKVKPEWLDWHRFLSTASEPDRRISGSSSVPTGVRAAPVNDAIATATGRKRALLVGLNYPGTPAALKGSINNVASISRVLLRLGFQEEWTLTLTDDQADPSFIPTHKNIVMGMRWLTQGAVSGDALLFHFSGHGVQQADGAEAALDDAFCPVDFSEAGYVTENEVFDCLVRELPSGVRLTMLIDSCLPCICPELPFIYELPKAQWAEEENPWHSAGDVICIGAELDEIEDLQPERLCALRDLEEGLVTSCFLQAIQSLAQQRKGPVTYLALISEVQEQLHSRGFQRRVRFSASQAFELDKRAFRFFDALENSNPEVGLRSKKIHRS